MNEVGAEFGEITLIDPQGVSEAIPKPPDLEMRSPGALAGDTGADHEASHLGGRDGEEDSGEPAARQATTLQALLGDFYDRVDPSRELLAYIRCEALPMAELYAFAGMIAIARVRFFPGRRFDFDDDGMPAVVIEALGDDAETIEDLVAWPSGRPDKFATALGRARGLGVDQAGNPASFFGGKPLQVWRTPLAWLKAGCRGVVVLDRTAAVLWLGDALGAVAGEGLAHAREVGRLLHPYVEPARVVFPVEEAA